MFPNKPLRNGIKIPIVQTNRSLVLKVSLVKICLMLLIVSGLFISCKSAPPVQKEAPAEPVAETAGVAAEEKPEVIEVDVIEEAVEPRIPQLQNEADLAGLERRKQEYAELGKILAEVRTKRQEIINAGFDDVDRRAFDEADDMLKRAGEVYDAGFEAFNESALEDARLALSSFNTIIDSVWMAKTEAMRTDSADKQQEALKLRADVAVKERYNLAAELHNKGTAAFRSKNYFVAIEFFEKSIPVFTEAIKTASEKKEKAELALKNAETKIIESEKIVEDAVKFFGDSTNKKGDVL
jgi:tetratricopeptide (TPR) repeat protein